MVRLATAVLTVALTTLMTAASSAAPSVSRPAPDISEYVALGDSYTAGPLIPDLLVAQGCFRSTNNYPALLARALQVDVVRDVSCSGAQTTNMLEPQVTALGTVPPQFSALTPTTDLVTVGVGGNDFGVFATLVDHCTTLRSQDPTGSPCEDEFTAGGSDVLLHRVHQTSQRLLTVVQQIRQRAPNARVIVVGYPQIVPVHGTCPDLLPLADGDYAYAGRIAGALNSGLRRAAAWGGAEFVSAYRATRGHSICAEDPWINGQYLDPTAAAAYHPFAPEMVAVADAVQTRLAAGPR